jgi:carbamate kinase
MTEEVQRRNIDVAASMIADLAREHEVIVTHGNGPQVGLLALESEAYEEVPPYGLDVLGAESQGMIGFMLQNALRNRLPERAIVTVITTVLVDADDASLSNPTKPIGPVYSPEVANELARKRGWTVKADGAGYRRVVPSPDPVDIEELAAIRALVDAGVLVICAGGGGVPVARFPGGELEGVEGVVDKDSASALLAEQLGADFLLLLTDVPAVFAGWGTPEARPLPLITPAYASRHQFAAGSMAPKVEAACRFVENTGRRAAIGALGDAMDILRGEAGTLVLPH